VSVLNFVILNFEYGNAPTGDPSMLLVVLNELNTFGRLMAGNGGGFFLIF